MKWITKLFTRKVKTFIYMGPTKNGITGVTIRPIVGDSKDVMRVYDWLNERKIESTLDYPRVTVELDDELLIEFNKEFNRFVIPQVWD